MAGRWLGEPHRTWYGVHVHHGEVALLKKWWQEKFGVSREVKKMGRLGCQCCNTMLGWYVECHGEALLRTICVALLAEALMKRVGSRYVQEL